MVSAYLLLTAYGFILDVNNFTLTKTGGLFLKFKPEDATLKINGKPRKFSAGLINQGVLIKNLVPHSYKITLSKKDFADWNKVLVVEPGKVAAESQIRLWPQNLTTKKTAENAADFWLTEKGIVYADREMIIHFGKYALKGENVITANRENSFLITANEQNYFVVNLENPVAATNINELFNSLKQRQLLFPGVVTVKNVWLHPFSQGKILIGTLSAVYSLDMNKIQLEKIYGAENLSLLAMSDNEIFVANGKNKITAVNLVLKTKTTLPIKIGEGGSMRTNPNGTKIFILTEKNELLFYDRSAQKTENISSDAKDFFLSPEEKRIAIVKKNGGTEIFYLSDYENDTKETRGSIFKIPLPQKETLSNFSWIQGLPNQFLAMDGDNLLISEIDSRPPLNFQILAGGVKKYFLQKKELFVLKENGDLLQTELSF